MNRCNDPLNRSATRIQRQLLGAAPIVVIAAALVACGGGGGGDGIASGGGAPMAPAPAPAPVPGAAPMLAAAPAWSAYAPDKVDKAEEGREISDPKQAETVEEIPSGSKTLSCTTRKVDFYKTPGEYAMFAPPTTVLYPGALVQGKSLRDGASPADILPLNIPERNPVTISIPACLTNDNSRTVPPTLDAVNQARASIVASAIAQNASCVSARGNLQAESYRNDVHKALAIGISGRYFGFSAAADASLSKSKSESGLSVTFKEQMYTVQYAAPRPEDVFTAAFTDARYRQLQANGEVGSDNPPVYVAEVTYGRIMNFSMISSSSETEMEQAVRAAYGVAGAPGSVAGKIDAEYAEVLKNARYSAAYVGGSAAATSAMLKNLNWGDYFAFPVGAADAVPISFTLKNLKDDSVALVQELTSYDLTTCVEKLADNATFAFKPEQTIDPSFSVPGTVLVEMADVDGRLGKDLILANSGIGGRGEFRVALSNGDGTFSAPVVGTFPAVVQTGDFQLAAGDIDADGRADIVLNVRDNTVGNRVYVAFYKDGTGGGGKAGFVYSAPQDMGGPGVWSNYPMRVAQMDGVRGFDLVWNNVPASTTTNTTYIAHAVDAKSPAFDLASSTLFVRTGSLNHFANNFSGYEYTHVDDFDGDGRADIVWHSIDAGGNAYYIARGTPTGLDFGGSSVNSKNWRNFGGTWGPYSALAGDVTGGSKADLVQLRRGCPFNEGADDKSCSFGIYVSQGSSSPTKAYTDSHAFQERDRVKDIAIADLLGRSTSPLVPDLLLADVDGDGRLDLIINDKGKSSLLSNKVGVGLGTAIGQFSFGRAAQDLGVSRDWSNYRAIVADVNGDRRDDLLWVSPGLTTSVYVGIARGN